MAGNGQSGRAEQWMAMIDPNTVSRILDAAQIVDVVSDFVTLRRRGANYVGLCPFHDEKTGSFVVSPAKGIFKCFGCGKAGGPVHFIMEHEQLDYPGALRYLAKKYGIEIVERELSAEEKQAQSERESLFAVNDWAARYFTETLNNTAEGRNVGISYFRERGFTDETIRKFGLGFCPSEGSAMCRAALAHGFKAEFIEKTGIGIKRDNGTWYDRFRGRVIFPVHTLSGKVVAFGGRVLEKNDKAAKYVNSPESEIYSKSHELYGIYFAKQSIVKADRCFLVEGYTDVISMHQAGVTNVVASSGTSLTEGQIRLIHRFTPNITVLYDGDSAGIKASVRGIDMLLAEGMNVKVVLLPDGEDPDSYARGHNASDFIRFIDENQTDFIHFKVNLLKGDAGNDPIKRAQLVQDVVRSVSLVPDRIVRAVYTKECAAMLDVEESILVSEVNRVRNAKRTEEMKRAGYDPNNGCKRVTDPAYRREAQGAVGQPTVQPNAAEVGDVPPPDVSDMPPEAYAEPQVSETENGTFAVRSPFHAFERNIMQYVVRAGGRVMCHEEGGDGSIVPLTVGRYVVEELAELRGEIGCMVHDEVYARMLDEMTEHAGSEGFDTARHFTSHTDPDVSREAADLLTEPYQLSRMFTKEDEYTGDPNDKKDMEIYMRHKEEKERKELADGVVRVVFEYKDAIVEAKEKALLAELREVQTSGDTGRVFEIIREQQKLKEIRKQLAAQLGQRVLTR